MRIYLVRHGEALSRDIDAQRALSEEGRKNIQKMASFLLPHGWKVGAIYHSDKLRAQQTAEILSTAITPEKGVLLLSGLAPNDPVLPILEKIKTEHQDTMLLGHLPFMEKLASLLLSGDESGIRIPYPPGGILCLQGDFETGWSLVWFVAPGLIA